MLLFQWPVTPHFHRCWYAKPCPLSACFVLILRSFLLLFLISKLIGINGTHHSLPQEQALSSASASFGGRSGRVISAGLLIIPRGPGRNSSHVKLIVLASVSCCVGECRFQSVGLTEILTWNSRQYPEKNASIHAQFMKWFTVWIFNETYSCTHVFNFIEMIFLPLALHHYSHVIDSLNISGDSESELHELYQDAKL